MFPDSRYKKKLLLELNSRGGQVANNYFFRPYTGYTSISWGGKGPKLDQLFTL